MEADAQTPQADPTRLTLNPGQNQAQMSVPKRLGCCVLWPYLFFY